MSLAGTCLQGAVRELIRLVLGIYFSRIERFHAERVPGTGPVLFVSNHPGSITDAFIIGTSVPRRVNFVGTVQLFRFRPLAWLLRHCGIIPINRVKDDPGAMRTVLDTFAACFRVLERGEAIGIFPEGISYEDSQLKTVKTGAARMALELEHRHGGQLGLQMVPVGLTYSGKERYRSDVLIHFGEPIGIGRWLEGYGDRRKECIHTLNREIERCLQGLILHLPKLEEARLVEGVKRLYLDRLKLGNVVVKEPLAPRAEELVLTQTIAQAVDQIIRTQPERAAAFARKLDHYERWLKRLRLPDTAVGDLSGRQPVSAGRLGLAVLAVAGLPVALYGWVHRLVPALFVDWAVGRFTHRQTRKAQTPHAAMLAGLVGFTGFYALYVALVQHWLGWPISLWYALSLPPAGLVAHYYLTEMRGLPVALRAAWISLRAPFVARRLVRFRARLVREIETARTEFRRTQDPGGGVSADPG